MLSTKNMVVFMVLTIAFSGCSKGKKPDKSNDGNSKQGHSQVGDGFLSFDIKPVSGNDSLWDATYTESGSVARFRLELKIKSPAGNSPFSMSNGAFHRVDNSDGTKLIASGTCTSGTEASCRHSKGEQTVIFCCHSGHRDESL